MKNHAALAALAIALTGCPGGTSSNPPAGDLSFAPWNVVDLAMSQPPPDFFGAPLPPDLTGAPTPPDLTMSQSTHFDPSTVSEASLRNFKGDFGGIQVPQIAPACPEDPTTHIRCQGDNGGIPHGLINGALFTPAYPNYTPAQRAAIRAAYSTGIGVDGKPRAYTHFPISLFCNNARWYHGLYPSYDCSAATLNGLLHELWDNQPPIYPVCFVLNDGETSVNLPAGFDTSLCRIVVPEWEMDGPLGGDTAKMNQAIVNTRNAFPNALLYVHFTSEIATAGTPGANWWSWASGSGADTWDSPALPNPHVVGLAYQSGTWNDVAATTTNLADVTSRLGGCLNGWPCPIDIEMFETDIYTKFWDGRTEQDGVNYNNQILTYMTTPLCSGGKCGTLRGFNSGGTGH